MPRQATNQLTFAEHLQQILQELAMAEVAPGADTNLVSAIRQQIIGSLQSVNAPVGGGPPTMGASPYPPGGVPVQPGDLSRGPTPGPDTSGMAGDLAALLSQPASPDQSQPPVGQPA